MYNDQKIYNGHLYSTVVSRGLRLRATLDARRVGYIIFVSGGTKTLIVIYSNNRIIVNIQISRYNGINTPTC